VRRGTGRITRESNTAQQGFGGGQSVVASHGRQRRQRLHGTPTKRQYQRFGVYAKKIGNSLRYSILSLSGYHVKQEQSRDTT